MTASGASACGCVGGTRTQLRIAIWVRCPGGAEGLPDLPVPERLRPARHSDKPIFFGHYWMTGEPALLSASMACVDYSAGKGGPLVAYRFEEGARMAKDRFASAG